MSLGTRVRALFLPMEDDLVTKRLSKKAYVESFRTRDWQKKRAEILQRADWCCEMCGNEKNSNQLHVHHRYYDQGSYPWEYPSEDLDCLCVDCHKEEEARKQTLKTVIRKLHGEQIEQVIEFVMQIKMEEGFIRGSS